MPNRGRIRYPRTSINRPRMTAFWMEVALNVREEAPPLVIE